MILFELAGIEDEENWHGKPLGAQSEAAIKAITDAISNKGPHGLTPKIPSNLAKPVNISNIKLSEPPTYDKGAQVSRAQFVCYCLVHPDRSGHYLHRQLCLLNIWLLNH